MNRSLCALVVVAAAGWGVSALPGADAARAQETGRSSAPDFDLSYSLESRAAIGAHHLCAGLWVVGQEHKRPPEQILAEDIAPFKGFSWDKSFAFKVDEAQKTVTVSG